MTNKPALMMLAAMGMMHGGIGYGSFKPKQPKQRDPIKPTVKITNVPKGCKCEAVSYEMGAHGFIVKISGEVTYGSPKSMVKAKAKWQKIAANYIVQSNIHDLKIQPFVTIVDNNVINQDL